MLEFKSYFESHCMMLCLCCPCVMTTVLTHIICDINESDVQRKGHSVLCYDGSE